MILFMSKAVGSDIIGSYRSRTSENRFLIACLVDKVRPLCKVRDCDLKNCAVPCNKHQEEVDEFDNHHSKLADDEDKLVQTSELNLCKQARQSLTCYRWM